MRYYKILVGDTTTTQTIDAPVHVPGQVFVNKSPPTTTTQLGLWTSVAGGANDPGALDIEFDIQFNDQQQMNGNYIKIKGITPQTISQANNLNKKRLQMWAGFTNGLPFANDQVAHQGLIVDGIIYPVFGNWIYNELSLDMIFQAGPPLGLGGPTNIKNIVHNMPAGQLLSTALKNTLQTAFPQASIIMNISSALKLNYNDYGMYQSIEQLGNYIKGLSHSILGNPPNYDGVKISANGNNITVTDGTANTGGAIPIQFEDLVGQPTWLGDHMQVTTQLRGDIRIGNYVTLPKTNVTQTVQGAISMGSANIASEYGAGLNYLNFQGTWRVVGVRFVGKFRSTQMDAWITILDCAAPGTGGGSPTSGATTSPPTGAPNASGQQIFVPPPNANDQGTPSLGGGI